MKLFIKAVAGALVITTPLVSFSQSNQPLTRAQVREQLIVLEKADWRPYMNMGNNPNYPAGIQAAEARVAARQAGAASVGGVADGTFQSGGPASAANTKAIYFGQK
jgi:hypothetical protein